MNQLDIIVFDLETGGLESNFHDAIQVAGKAFNSRSLEPYPPEEGGEFVSLMKPLHFDRLTPGAERVHKITPEILKGAPDQKIVWNQFVAWVNKFNTKGTKYGAPIAAGKNIRAFDMKFVEVLNQLHCPKKEKTLLFNQRMQLDLEDVMFLWFENDGELSNMKMDTLRQYFGMNTEGAHNALVDVRQTGELLIRFLKLHRELRRRVSKSGGPLIKLEGSMSGVC